MSIKIKSLTAKNFLSIGNVSQGVDFDRKDIVLILGENLDVGGENARNGTGKSTSISAMSYALYGSAVTDIKKENLKLKYRILDWFEKRIGRRLFTFKNHKIVKHFKAEI